MIVEISGSKLVKGTIEYDVETHAFFVVYPQEDKAFEITQYLSAQRVFKIPESSELDDYRNEVATPTDSLMHFELALCELWAHVKIFVNWETRRE